MRSPAQSVKAEANRFETRPPRHARVKMDRRKFLAASTAAASLPMYRSGNVNAQDEAEIRTNRPDYSDYSKDPRPDVPEGTCTAGAKNGPVFKGFPVVSGPSPDSISILQPLQRTATGFLEYSIENGSWNRVDAGEAGLLPLSNNVLKFRLPKLPPGKVVTYRIVAQSIGWTKVRQFYHGVIEKGKRQVSKQYRFKTTTPNAKETKFAVWNDTHENDVTIVGLVKQTKDFQPDFLLWNGDQSNDCHFEQDMAGQFLNPAGLSIADAWPLAYVRGNHECRGPAARSLPEFTGSPGDLFYYGFRSKRL